MTTALITGATGYVGRNLVRGLLDKGDEVIACARTQSDLDTLAEEHKNRALQTFALDVTDAAATAQTVARYKPDIIINASGFPKRKSAENTDENIPFEQTLLYKLNVEGSRNIAQAAARIGHPAHLIIVSSGAVFDQRLKHVDINSARSMDNPFEKSKNIAEAAVEKAVFKAPHIKTSILYAPVILDISQTKGIIPSAVSNALKGENIVNNSAPDASVNMILSDDFNRVVLAVAENQKDHFVRYPISGYRINTCDLLNKVSNIVSKSTRKKVPVLQGAETSTGMPEADESEIKKLMGDHSWQGIDGTLKAIVQKMTIASPANTIAGR